ncbi:MAG: glutathione S-transferase N-terminal domain-containing protein [Actinomycetes bacterium]|nr:glutathione S-transferase N-terminal domain-containing protein [Actinomycetes bacterium]
MTEYILYYYPYCPYCRKVLDWLVKNRPGWEAEIELRDATDVKVMDELAALGGERQVPCLVIDGDPLYESADIIAYLGGLDPSPFGGETCTITQGG